MPRAASVIAALLCIAAQPLSSEAQSAQATAVPTEIAKSLLWTPGPKWESAYSDHFLLFAERHRRRYNLRSILDSLETAWQSAVTLLQRVPADEPRVSVIVTRSRARLIDVLPPLHNSIAITRSIDGAETLLLVVNDKVHAPYRHEVMHVVSKRAWGAGHLWISEGLAMWADGRCHGQSIMAVARDALRRAPRLTPETFMRDFSQHAAADRPGAQAIAASLVQFLFHRGGIAEVRRAWNSNSSAALIEVTPADTSSMDWRSFVEWSSAGQPGVPEAQLKRHGCG